MMLVPSPVTLLGAPCSSVAEHGIHSATSQTDTPHSFNEDWGTITPRKIGTINRVRQHLHISSQLIMCRYKTLLWASLTQYAVTQRRWTQSAATHRRWTQSAVTHRRWTQSAVTHTRRTQSAVTQSCWTQSAVTQPLDPVGSNTAVGPSRQ